MKKYYCEATKTEKLKWHDAASLVHLAKNQNSNDGGIYHYLDTQGLPDAKGAVHFVINYLNDREPRKNLKIKTRYKISKEENDDVFHLLKDFLKKTRHEQYCAKLKSRIICIKQRCKQEKLIKITKKHYDSFGHLFDLVGAARVGAGYVSDNHSVDIEVAASIGERLRQACQYLWNYAQMDRRLVEVNSLKILCGEKFDH